MLAPNADTPAPEPVLPNDADGPPASDGRADGLAFRPIPTRGSAPANPATLAARGDL